MQNTLTRKYIVAPYTEIKNWITLSVCLSDSVCLSLCVPVHVYRIICVQESFTQFVISCFLCIKYWNGFSVEARMIKQNEQDTRGHIPQLFTNTALEELYVFGRVTIFWKTFTHLCWGVPLSYSLKLFLLSRGGQHYS